MKSKFVIGYYNLADLVTLFGLLCGVFSCVLVAQHPIVAMILIGLAALCDTMDGKIARTNKKSTKRERFYGVQLDSLCDLVSFGVAPCFMAYNLGYQTAFDLILYALFIACGAIRLANFNTEAALDTTDLRMRHFTGIPIPISGLVFPVVFILHLLTDGNVGWLFRIMFLLVGFGYICRVRFPKPTLKQQMIIGGFELLCLLIIIIVAIVKK